MGWLKFFVRIIRDFCRSTEKSIWISLVSHLLALLCSAVLLITTNNVLAELDVSVNLVQLRRFTLLPLQIIAGVSHTTLFKIFPLLYHQLLIHLQNKAWWVQIQHLQTIRLCCRPPLWPYLTCITLLLFCEVLVRFQPPLRKGTYSAQVIYWYEDCSRV